MRRPVSAESYVSWAWDVRRYGTSRRAHAPTCAGEFGAAGVVPTGGATSGVVRWRRLGCRSLCVHVVVVVWARCLHECTDGREMSEKGPCHFLHLLPWRVSSKTSDEYGRECQGVQSLDGSCGRAGCLRLCGCRRRCALLGFVYPLEPRVDVALPLLVCVSSLSHIRLELGDCGRHPVRQSCLDLSCLVSRQRARLLESFEPFVHRHVHGVESVGQRDRTSLLLLMSCLDRCHSCVRVL